MTSENRKDLSRPKTAVRDRLDEVRRRLAEAGDRWHGNTGGSFNAPPPCSANAGLKESLELEEVGPDLLDDLGEVWPANEPHARLGRRGHKRDRVGAVTRIVVPELGVVDQLL